MKTNYKVGDWVFCEFKLQKIEGIEEDRIISVSDGFICHGGYSLNDNCFPLTLQNKVISDEIKSYSDRLHKEGSNSLNYPDIHGWLVEHWVKMCQTTDNEALKKLYSDADNFTNAILNRCRDLRQETKNGIKIFRS
jgi:hypothetical protein